MKKTEARAKAKEYRKNLDTATKSAMDEAIKRTFLSLEKVKNARKICVYLSILNEVETSEIIKELLLDGKELCAPVVVGDNMIARRFLDISDLKSGAYGILEPQGKIISPSELDLIVVPMVAYNLSLDRIGYGKGYYDRFLPKGIMTVGLAYHGQRFDFTPDRLDKPLDMIVTDEGVLVCE